jgi:hypothetical protein
MTAILTAEEHKPIAKARAASRGWQLVTVLPGQGLT